MTHLTAIEKHEKLLEKFKANNSNVKNRNCQIQDLLHMEYTATDFAQVIKHTVPSPFLSKNSSLEKTYIEVN